jgi:hypothetical protein
MIDKKVLRLPNGMFFVGEWDTDDRYSDVEGRLYKLDDDGFWLESQDWDGYIKPTFHPIDWKTKPDLGGFETFPLDVRCPYAYTNLLSSGSKFYGLASYMKDVTNRVAIGNGYQGTDIIMFKDFQGRFGLLLNAFGTCSVCDVLQGVEQDGTLRDFIIFIEERTNSIMWFNTVEEVFERLNYAWLDRQPLDRTRDMPKLFKTIYDEIKKHFNVDVVATINGMNIVDMDYDDIDDLSRNELIVWEAIDDSHI